MSNPLWKHYPVDLIREADSITLKWQDFQTKPLSEPFFGDSRLSLGLTSFSTGHQAEKDLAHFSSGKSLSPSAFIFHASRCGSTLVSQLLASFENHIVVSEAPVIEASLNLFHQYPRHKAEHILKGIINAFGQKRLGHESRFFLKMESWQINQLPLIHSLFPDTPKFFLYRKPREILRSHRRLPGMHMVKGVIEPAILGLKNDTSEPYQCDQYAANVLACYLNNALKHSLTAPVILINYEELPEAIFEKILPTLSINLTDDQIESLKQRLLFHSKDSTRKFSKANDQTAPQPAHPIDLTQVEKAYQTLEKRRLS